MNIDSYKKQYSKVLNKTELDIKEVNSYTMQQYKNIESKKNPKNEKLEAFKKRLEAFNNVFTYEEAKELLDRTMPIQLDRITFFLGDAKCTIVDRNHQIRIYLRNKNEIIAYDFS